MVRGGRLGKSDAFRYRRYITRIFTSRRGRQNPQNMQAHRIAERP